MSLDVGLELVIIGVILGGGILWIWMLIDCLTRKFSDSNDKIIWVLVLIFTQALGALVYYFLIKRKDSRPITS